MQELTINLPNNPRLRRQFIFRGMALCKSYYNNNNNLYNLRFADDVDLMGVSNGELQDLTNRLLEREMAYEIEVNTEKSKIVTNGTNCISTDMSMNGQKLEKVSSFK